MFIKPTQHYTWLVFSPRETGKGKRWKQTVNMLNIWIVPKRKPSDREVAAREEMIDQLKLHLQTFHCPSCLWSPSRAIVVGLINIC